VTVALIIYSYSYNWLQVGTIVLAVSTSEYDACLPEIVATLSGVSPVT
jgi:hypothetical protein